MRTDGWDSHGNSIFIEPWWPLGDSRWVVFSIVCLIGFIATYFLPDELKWVTRVQESSAWKLFRFRAAVFLRGKNHPERSEAKEDLGWEEEGLNDPRIEERHERELRRALGLDDRDPYGATGPTAVLVTSGSSP